MSKTPATERTFDEARDALLEARDEIAVRFGLDEAEIDTAIADTLAFSICEHAYPGQERDALEVFIAGMRRRYADLMHEDTTTGAGGDLATIRPAGRA
jgi:hypothetical protein